VAAGRAVRCLWAVPLDEATTAALAQAPPPAAVLAAWSAFAQRQPAPLVARLAAPTDVVPALLTGAPWRLVTDRALLGAASADAALAMGAAALRTAGSADELAAAHFALAEAAAVLAPPPSPLGARAAVTVDVLAAAPHPSLELWARLAILRPTLLGRAPAAGLAIAAALRRAGNLQAASRVLDAVLSVATGPASLYQAAKLRAAGAKAAGDTETAVMMLEEYSRVSGDPAARARALLRAARYCHGAAEHTPAVGAMLRDAVACAPASLPKAAHAYADWLYRAALRAVRNQSSGESVEGEREGAVTEMEAAGAPLALQSEAARAYLHALAMVQLFFLFLSSPRSYQKGSGWLGCGGSPYPHGGASSPAHSRASR
jgi:hypothetical protein